MFSYSLLLYHSEIPILKNLSTNPKSSSVASTTPTTTGFDSYKKSYDSAKQQSTELDRVRRSSSPRGDWWSWFLFYKPLSYRISGRLTVAPSRDRIWVLSMLKKKIKKDYILQNSDFHCKETSP